MTKTVNGDILNCTEDVIVHQVNVAGAMGGGVARQLANQYKGLEEAYSKYCKDHNNRYINLCGNVFYYQAKDKIIANMFSQHENFDTDYLNMKVALKDIREYAKQKGLSVCMPYGIGCGIARGNWNIVLSIIDKVFKDCKVTLYKLENGGKEK